MGRGLVNGLGYLTMPVVLLDGDEFRSGISADLGFTISDRSENIRRAAGVAKLLNNQGVIVIGCFVSPTPEIRGLARSIIGVDSFLEIYVKAGLKTCRLRDTKGLYSRAVAGELKHMTGIDEPYVEPSDPDLILDTEANSIETNIDVLLEFARNRMSEH